VSIIDDIRIKQDIDKEGKYVCDLDHKEETKIRTTTNTAGYQEILNFYKWHEVGIEIKGIDTVEPANFMDAAVLWFQYSKKYKWKFPHDTLTRETYIRNIIKDLEDLI